MKLYKIVDSKKRISYYASPSFESAIEHFNADQVVAAPKESNRASAVVIKQLSDYVGIFEIKPKKEEND